MAGLNPDLGKRRRQKTWADPAVDLKVLTSDLGTQLEYGFTYLGITHIRSAHGKNGPSVHTTSAGTDTHRPMCVDLMPWVRDRGVYAQQKGWGQGGPGLQLTCRMGISLSSARHSSSRRALGHGQCSTGSSVADPYLSRALQAVPTPGLPRSLLWALLSQPTSPSAALMLFQHSLAAPLASS